MYIKQLGISNGAVGNLFGTGPNNGFLKPDAWVNNGGAGYIWELKPGSWQSGPKYAAAQAQLLTYIYNANRNSMNGGTIPTTWNPGPCQRITGAPNARLPIGMVPHNGYMYEIFIYGDPNDPGSGLLFYDFVRGEKAEEEAERVIYSAEESTEEASITDMEYWEEVTGLTGAALILYLIFSEGSRLFPPRNAIPVP